MKMAHTRANLGIVSVPYATNPRILVFWKRIFGFLGTFIGRRQTLTGADIMVKSAFVSVRRRTQYLLSLFATSLLLVWLRPQAALGLRVPHKPEAKRDPMSRLSAQPPCVRASEAVQRSRAAAIRPEGPAVRRPGRKEL